MRSFLLFAAAVLLPAGESDAANVYYDWDLDDFLDNTLAPDCLDIVKADRPLFLADGSYPGPPIDVNEGDRVHVCAVLLYATLCSETIHIAVFNAVWPFVIPHDRFRSLCPIQKGADPQLASNT